MGRTFFDIWASDMRDGRQRLVPHLLASTEAAYPWSVRNPIIAVDGGPVDEETEGVVPLKSSTLAEAEASTIPAVLPSDQMAMEIIKVLDLIAARLELQTPRPSTAKRVRGARTVPREFVLSLLAAAERRPESPLGRFDTARARDVLESGDALRLLSERTTMFLASLNYTYEARWAEVAADAMEAFSTASIIASRNPRLTELAAEVENLRKLLRRKGTKKKEKANK
jgi:hypothetical protein